MPLSSKDVRHLRALAHKLKPVVITGNAGLSEGVLSETDAALAHHELIKVRVNAADRAERQAMIEEICHTTGAELVQTIGHIAIFYRSAKKPIIQLSAGRRP